MACLTNNSLILGVGAVGDVCSGHGQCIAEQCVCDEFWTGRADLMPLEGFACQNPVIFDRLLWSFAAFMHVRLFLQSLPVLRFQFQQYLNRRRANARDACGTFPAILVLEAFAVPALAAIFIARAATNENFGVNVAISVSFALVFPIYLFAVAFMEVTLFKHMILGTAEVGSHSDAVALVNFDRRMTLIGTLFYTCLHVGANIAGIFLPFGPTPERIGIIVARNVGTNMYFAWFFCHQSRIRQRVILMLSSKTDDARLNRALAKIDEALQMGRKRMIIMFVLYTLFTVCPPLLSFQYFVSSLMLGIACGGNHILRQLSSGRESNKTASSSDQHNHKTVKSEENKTIVPASNT